LLCIESAWVLLCTRPLAGPNCSNFYDLDASKTPQSF